MTAQTFSTSHVCGVKTIHTKSCLSILVHPLLLLWCLYLRRTGRHRLKVEQEESGHSMFSCHLFRQMQSVEVGMEGFFLKYLALRPDTRNWSRMSPFLSVPLILTYLLSHSCDITHLWKSRGSFVRTLFVLYRNFRISSNEKGRFKNNSRIRYLQFELKNFRGKSNVAIPLGSKTLFTSFAQSLGSFKCSRSWELLILLKQSSLKGKNCASATMVIFSDLYMSTLMSPFGASPEPISSDRSFLSKLPRPQVCQQMAGEQNASLIWWVKALVNPTSRLGIH